MKTHFSLIAAVGDNLELGGNQSLLWDQPKDRQRFKTLTMGHVIVMGRKTWESLPVQPLPGRRNIVMTRQPDFSCPLAEVANSTEMLKQMTSGEAEVFVIGGGELFKTFLPTAENLYLTRIIGTFAQADTFFPKINFNEWKLLDESFVEQDEANPFAMIFQYYKRIK